MSLYDGSKSEWDQFSNGDWESLPEMFCVDCEETLAPEQFECPFCGRETITYDQWVEDNGQFGVGA